MRTIFIFLLTTSVLFVSCNQKKDGETKMTKEEKKDVMDNKSNRVSPPATITDTIEENIISVNYGSPKVKGRVIWGGLVPYGEVWRTGANEATTVEFTKDVFIEQQPLTKGVYSLFTIPSEKEWIIIFSTNSKQWGAFKYNETEDALRVKISPTLTDSLYEDMRFSILSDSANNTAGSIQFNWEKLQWNLRFHNAPSE